jgi:ABC-type oligopeptide transport system substrate-binding subunit
MKSLLSLIATFLLASHVSAAGVDTIGKTITIGLTVEPPSLDNTLAEDTTSAAILRLTNEGLTRIGARGRLEPAVAESWVITEREVTFSLRKTAVWEDGSPVTAHDFVFSWRRLVNPKTGATGSTFFSYIFKNGEAILRGEKAIETLGATALDDHTLRITLSRPVPYLLNVLAGPPYFPIKEAFYNQQHGRYGADAANIQSNGPFIMKRWIHHSSIELVKNPTYWNASEIYLNEFNVGYITSDVRSMLNLYKSGEIAMLNLSEETLGDAADAGLRIRKNPTSCLAWLFLNMDEGRVTANKKVREAIRLAFDRDRYINTIVGLPGTRKIDSIFTKRIDGIERDFQSEFPAPKIEFNLTRARALIEQAKVEMGVDKIPPIVLLANETRQIEAEFLQAQLGNALGIEIKVDKQTFKQALVKMSTHDFDIARAGFCGGSIRDPVFFAGIFTSHSPFNDVVYQNPEYDRLMALTHSSSDPKVRMQAFSQMQQLLYEDIPIIPSHESSNVYVEDVRLKGILRYPLVDYSRGKLK